MTPEVANDVRRKFRAYKRNASRLRDCLDALGDASVLSLNISWDAERGSASSFDEKAPIILLAALLRPFMTEGSPIELRAFWSALRSAGLVDEATIEMVEQKFVAADRLIIPFVFNGRAMTAREIYFAYAEGEFFDENPKARDLLRSMSFVAPAADLLRYLFFNCCATYAKLTLTLIDVILLIERGTLLPRTTDHVEQMCIYCLTTSGDFSSEEHVFPEAFGIDEMVLENAVCKSCNNELSRLDQFIAEDFELLAFLRVVHVPLTKKGKFPHADFRDFQLEKVKPRMLRITNKGKKDVLVTRKESNGTWRGSLQFTSRRPVDIIRLARALFKIGLGMVAADKGVAFACDERFHAARAFVRGKGMMPNHLLIMKTGKPVGTVAGTWQSYDGATGVELLFYGVRFVFNLEPSPLSVTPDSIGDQFQAFWLGENAKNGIVAPCSGVCNHATSAARL